MGADRDGCVNAAINDAVEPSSFRWICASTAAGQLAEPLSFFDSQNYAADLSHVFRNVRERPRSEATNCASTGWRSAPSGVSKYLPLKGRFRKSLSMSGEVGSLAGDRVVSHERSRPADLPRREDPRSGHARPYPSHYRGRMSWCALLAGDPRRRKAVRAREIRLTRLSAGNQLLDDEFIF